MQGQRENCPAAPSQTEARNLWTQELHADRIRGLAGALKPSNRHGGVEMSGNALKGGEPPGGKFSTCLPEPCLLAPPPSQGVQNNAAARSPEEGWRGGYSQKTRGQSACAGALVAQSGAGKRAPLRR